MAVELSLLKAVTKIQVTLDDLRREVREQRAMLLKLTSEDVSISADDLPQDISLPLLTMEQVDVLEVKLCDHTITRVLINRLASVGGSTLKENVRRIMSEVLSNDLAMHFNWIGKGSWKSLTGIQKRGFRDLRICKVITRAVLKNPALSNATEAEIRPDIMAWLRNAVDRNGGRKRRSEVRRHHQPEDNDDPTAILETGL